MNNTSVIFGLVAAPSKTAQILKVIAEPKKKVVVVLFTDGTKEVVKCSKEDEFDIYVGVAIAEARHKYKTTSRFHRTVDRVLITLKPKAKKAKKVQTEQAVPEQRLSMLIDRVNTTLIDEVNTVSAGILSIINQFMDDTPTIE